MKNIPAHLSLFSCNLIWACAYPLYNFVMPTHIKPLPLLTATVIFTALLSIISLLFSHKSSHIDRRDIGAIVGAALLIAVLRKGMLLFGLSLTSPIDGSIIATISPVVVLCLSVLLGLEHFTKGKAIGVCLGLAGALGVILTGTNNGGSSNSVVGNTLILLCAFISAIYILWFKSLLRRYEPMTILRWMFCIAAVIEIPFGIKPLLQVDVSNWSLHVWLAIAYLVVMPTYLPNLLLTSGLRQLSPTISSIYTYVQPAVAVAISVGAGLAKLHPITVLFALLIFTGVWIVISSPRTNNVAHL